MVDRITPPILNPQSVSSYDMLHVVRHCHAADTPQKTINHEVFFKLPASVNFTAYHCTILYLLTPWRRVVLEKLTSKLCS
jgi:hypothetical protein